MNSADQEQAQASEKTATADADYCLQLDNTDALDHSLRELLAEHESPVEYFTKASRIIARYYHLPGVLVSGRIGAETFRDYAATSRFNPEQRDELRERFDAFVRSCHGEPGSLLSSPIQLAGQTLQFFVNSLHDDEIDCTVGFCTFQRDKIQTQLANAEVRLALQRMHLLFVESRNDLPPEIHSTVETTVPEPKAAQPQTDSQPTQESHPQVKTAPAERHLPSLDKVAKVGRYQTVREFAFALVNSLANRFDCQQVAFGERKGERIAVQAVSGKDSIKANSPGIIDVQQAMEEALDAGVSSSFQRHGVTTKHNTMPVHTQWGTKANLAVLSIPMLVEETCVAVVSLSRDSERGFSAADVDELEQLIASFGPAVELAIRGQRGLREHLASLTRESLARIREPQTSLGRRVRIAACVAAVVFLFGWFPFRPTIPCEVVPADMTQTLAPFDMQLEEVLVQSGDRVVEGQTLVRFDTRDLELQRSNLKSLRDKAEVEVRSALLAGDAAAAALAKSNSNAQLAQLRAVEKKLELCTIVAPSNGMIVAAELERKIGQVLPQGSPVLTFAPMHEFALEIHVPEHSARHITADQIGTFVSAADPASDTQFRIESVSGSAELIEGSNVFVAKAKLDGFSQHYRQGMKGFARTSAGWKPIPWLVFHRVYEYARSHFWL